MHSTGTCVTLVLPTTMRGGKMPERAGSSD
jgi:hypothetical protein